MKKLASSLLAGIFGGLVVLGGLHWFSLYQPSSPSEEVSNYSQKVSYRWNTNPRSHSLPFDFSTAAEKAMPVVVHISSSQDRTIAQERTAPGFQNDPFRFFFGDDFFFDFPYDAPLREGTGSGVIVSPDGYIVTNNHVVEFADKIEVTLFDERTFTAEVVGVDERTDLAVLKIDMDDELPVLEYADSDQARVGEWVMAVGNPFDLTSTVTAGIISAKGRDIDIIRRRDAIENFIQTDAAVNPGNSGGALVDIEGKLLGINTAIASPTGAFAGYSFAIPSNMVSEIVSNIITYGGPRAELGINVMDMDEELAREEDLKVTTGVFVDEVLDGSAAQYGGILPKDVIVGFNGQKIENAPQLIALLENSKPGETIWLEINRGGKEKEVELLLRPVPQRD
jgi:serine protease Do